MPNLDTARSWLFVPASRPERVAKALGSGAHVVVVDFEDSVPPAGKAAARDAVLPMLDAKSPVLVRINGAGTPWFGDDLRAVRASDGVAGVVLPKAEDSETLDAVAAVCSGLALLPLIESARGLAAAESLAAHAATLRLLFGSLDLRLDLGLEDGSEDDLLFHRSHLVWASRLAGKPPPVDGVTVAVHDGGRLQADVERARRLGFGGKLCIHPSQVETVNRGFSPPPDAVERARRILDAAADAEAGVVMVDGSMVDRPVVEQARRIVASSKES